MRESFGLLALVFATACSKGPSPQPAAPVSGTPASEAPATEAPATEAPASVAPETAAAPATDAGPPVEAVKISATLSAEEQTRADTLAGDVLTGRLNQLATRQAENARIFLHLAATHPRAKVVAAALQAMGRTWRRTGNREAPLVDADYTAVVLARLASAETPIRGGALSAARLLLSGDKPDEAVLAIALQLLKSGSVPERVVAASLVMSVRDFQAARPASGDLQARIFEALLAAAQSPDVPVVSIALDQLSRGAWPGVPQREALEAAARAGLSHEEPGVRGPATLLLARLARPADREAFARTLLPGLEHPNPYVKAATAEALASLAFRPAVHGVMPLLDIAAESTLNVGGFTELDGQPGQVELLLEGGRRVDSVALNALRELTGKAFDFKGGVTNQSRAGLVEQAKAWYTQNQAKFPKP